MSANIEKMHEDAFRKKAATWSFREEFLDTDRLRKLTYGNLVLRRQAHLFLSHGVILASVLLGLFWIVSANWKTIGSLFGLLDKDDHPMVQCYEVVTSVTQLPPPPPLDVPEPAPVTPSEAPPPPNVGKIKQVSKEEAPVQQTVATQQELKQAIQTQGAGSGAVSEDTPMFVPCEKMPGFLDQKKPVYPEMARISGITGKVFVAVLIGEDGRPMKAKVMKRIPADCDVFDACAIKSVMESRYYPGMQNGAPIKVWFTVPIRFQLD
ncbi:MAG: energy transducer TonB [Chlorobiaceae bacterium]|nr:energy transducer TonB [Chlorobiaceae bacterium]NTW10052.1 energy transducer TonB [Chlorobiaceae bacterium]